MTKPDAIVEYATLVVDIGAILEDLQSQCNDMFGIHPDHVTWGNVGDMEHVKRQLELLQQFLNRGA